LLDDDNFELVKNRDCYICLDKSLSNIATIVAEVSLLDSDNDSPLNVLNKYIKGGFLIGLYDEVLFVLHYADSLLSQQKDNTIAHDVRINLNALIDTVVRGGLSLKKYEAMRGVRFFGFSITIPTT